MPYCDGCGKYTENPRKEGYAIVDDDYEEKSYLLCFRCLRRLRRWEEQSAPTRSRGSSDTTIGLLKGADKKIGETLRSADWLLPKKRRR